jgi:anti-sigma regulatory factor (Ser/Thr protein kinase)
MDEKLFIQIKNRKSEIARVSQSFKHLATSQNLPVKVINAIDLALDELLNNIISYGYEDHNEHEISIELKLSKNQIVLSIIDDGKEFNPLDIHSADTKSSLQERSIGGLGIHLVKNVIDEIDYKYENNKNYLTMKKDIRGK